MGEFKEGMRVIVAKPDPNLGRDAEEYVGQVGVIERPWGLPNPYGYVWCVDLGGDNSGLPFREDELALVDIKVIEGVVNLYHVDYYVDDAGISECITSLLDTYIGKRIRLTIESLE